MTIFIIVDFGNLRQNYSSQVIYFSQLGFPIAARSFLVIFLWVDW